MIHLRPRQQKAIEDARTQLRAGNRAPVVVAATGAGKTIIAGGFIHGAISKGRKILFLAHREELITQCHDKLKEFDVTAGLIKAGMPMSLVYPTQVASIQTLVRRMDKISWRPDLIIIDEAHLSNAASYKKIISHYGNPPLIGLTATPCRLDGSGLGIAHGGLFDSMVFAGTTRELINEGLLAPFKYFAPPKKIDLTRLHTSKGDYNQTELAEATNTREITGDCIAHWMKLARGVPTMAFTVTVKHAETVAAQMRESGIRAVAVSGESSDAVRRSAVTDVQNGRLDVVVNCGLFIEGLDAPALGCMIDLAATQSMTRYRQKIGRVLRLYHGKPHAIILDHVGNVRNHGLPDEEIEWSLEGRRKRSKTDLLSVPVKECPKCYATHRPAHTCPECGHVYQSASRSEIQVVDGELVEVGFNPPPPPPTEAEKKAATDQIRAAKTLTELRAIAQARGYAPGWAEHRHSSAEKLRQKWQGDRA